MSVISEQEKARNFYRADARLRQSEAQLEHLRLKCREIAEFGIRLKGIFSCGRDVREVLKTAEHSLSELRKDNAWPDTSDTALMALLDEIRGEVQKRLEAAEELEMLRVGNG